LSTFSVEDRYDCTVARLHATITNAEYLAAKFPTIGFRDVAVVSAGPTGVETRRTVVAPLPGFARKVLGETQTVTQIESWTATADRADGTFTAHAQGTPIRIAGTMTIEPGAVLPGGGLDPDGGGCVLRIRGEVTVKVPLIGGKISDLVAAEATKTLQREYVFTQQWLAAAH
jgi:hypothetical protein